MATPFEHSMRSLKVRDPRKIIAALIVTIVLIILWLLWFFLARITIYQVSQPLNLNDTSVIVAKFPLEVSPHLQSGQNARLIIDGELGADLGPILGIVDQISPKTEKNIVEASIFMYWEQTPQIYELSTLENLTAKVEVETEQITLATMLLRAANSSVSATSN